MARIRYQPATKTKGFQPIQLTRDGISRMREETNRVVQGMEKNLAAEQRQRQENLQAMQDNAAYTEQITKENRAIELQNLKNEELSIRQTEQRDQQQAQYNADSAQTILSSLSDFSATIAKTSAQRTADQLKDQTRLAAAVDTSTILPEIVEAYKKSEASLLKGGFINTTELVAEGAQNGERPSKTLSNIAAEAGLGAVGRKALLNRLYGEVHGTFVSNAFADTEKKYEINGVAFSGIEASYDPEKAAIVQADINEKLAEFFLRTYGISEALYLTDGKTTAQKRDAIIRDRAEVSNQKFQKEIILQKAADIALGGTTNNYTAAYDLVIKSTGSFAQGHQFLTDQIGFAETDAQVEAIGNIITDDGRLYKDRFPNKFKPAVQARIDALNKRNRETRRVQKETLDNNLFQAREPILQRLNENPEEIYNKVTEEYYAQGATPPTWFKEAYRSAITGANERFAEELARLERAGGVVSKARVNAEENLTNREKLKKLRSAQIEQQYGGQAGLDQLKGLEALARKRTNIAVNGGRNSSVTYTLLAGMEQRWREHFAATQDVVKATQLLEADLLEADKGDNPNALFFAKYDNDGNALSYPNLNSTDLDTDQRLTLLQTKVAAKLSLGEIVDMPGMLGKPSDLAAISVQSETSNDIQFTRETMYLAMKFNKKPSEIHNAQVMANNKAFGTNTPLINPTIKSEAIDNASPEDARMINSVFRAQTNRGGVNYLGTANMPGNIRPSMLGPTGALTYKANKQAYINIGTAIQSAGFRIGEHSAFDQVDPVHAGNSYHKYDEAFDITHQTGDYNTSIAKTKQLKELIRSMNIFKEVIGPGDGDPNHATHLHLGGLLRPITQEELDLINSIN